MGCPIETTWELLSPRGDDDGTPNGLGIAWFVRMAQLSPLGGRVTTVGALRGFSDKYGQRNDCYVGLNPVSDGWRTKASGHHVLRIQAVVLDIDPVSEQASPDLAQERIIEYAQDLLGLDLHPDRIDSGRGRQLWLRFEPVPVSTQEEKQRWRGAVGAFLNRLDQITGIVGNMRVDTSCCDLPRLVRLPGTINTKTGRLAQFLEIGQSDSRVREAILSRFGMESAPSHTNGIGDGGDWRHNAHWLSGRAKWFIYHGVSEPGRHSAAFAAASSMKELGASLLATEAAVLRGAERCSPPLSEYEAKRCVRNAFAKGD
jgi:hypothetical protein